MSQSEPIAINPVLPVANGPIGRLSRRFGGAKAKELERFLKFAVVGIIGAVIDLTTTNLLLKTVFVPTSPADVTPLRIAASIGFTLAVISNFIWNRYWTYPDSRSRPLMQQILQFFGVNLVGLGIRYIVLGIFTPIFGNILRGILTSLNEATLATLASNAAILLALGIVMMWNFVVNRYWTYNDVK